MNNDFEGNNNDISNICNIQKSSHNFNNSLFRYGNQNNAILFIFYSIPNDRIYWNYMNVYTCKFVH